MARGLGSKPISNCDAGLANEEPQSESPNNYNHEAAGSIHWHDKRLIP